MNAVVVKVDSSGRVVIPKDQRIQLGIPDGGELRLTVEDGELRGLTRMAALRRLQDRLQASMLPGTEHRSAVDELLAERRAEAQRDMEEDLAWKAAHDAKTSRTP